MGTAGFSAPSGRRRAVAHCPWPDETLGVEVLDVPPSDMSEVHFPTAHEVIQTLRPQTLNPPLRVSIHIRSTWPNPDDPRILSLKHLVEALRKLGVAIHDQLPRSQSPLRHLHRSVSSLLSYPRPTLGSR